MGTQSEEARSTESQKLMTYGFRYFETVSLYSGNETLKKVRVWGGSHSSINVGLVNDVVVTIGRGARDSLAAHMDITNEIYAPLSERQELGILSVKMNEEVLLSPKLVALKAVEQAGFFSRAWDEIELFFLKLFDGVPLEI
jgi:D-alanyl-D-alanine carboxypeptidase (penicillin-binding protein 5/6)